MKNILSLLLLLSLAISTVAQTSDSLKGKWNFEKFYHAPGETIDSAKDAKMSKMFKSMAFNFLNDYQITLSLFGKEEEARYTYNQKKKRIIVNAPSKKVTLEIVKYDGDRMVLKFSDMVFWVKKE